MSVDETTRIPKKRDFEHMDLGDKLERIGIAILLMLLVLTIVIGVVF